jgi:alpha-amylase
MCDNRTRERIDILGDLSPSDRVSGLPSRKGTPLRSPQPMIRFLLLAPLAWLLLAVPRPASAQPPDGVADEIFYQFMPIAWRDSDGDAQRFGDFGGMTASLDYLEQLGITAIWMNPIFPSPAYHGYQHGAADDVNEWFGTSDDLIAFLEAAHARSIKVFVDFVAYGISQDSIWFQDAYGNPASPYDGWLAFTDSENLEYQGSPYPTWNGDTVGFIHWDLRDPHPVALVTQWAQHWLDPDGDGDFSDGVDGYRLDHVWQSYPYGPDGWGYHIDTFWAPWRQALRAVNPDVFVFAEQADWNSHGSELLEGMDAAFTKPFESAARMALAAEQAGSLYAQMTGTLAALDGSPYAGTFLCTIGNHDVDRLASAIGSGYEKGKAAAAVLLTQPFPPVIYYGDEIGMLGSKNPDFTGDAADIPMREPFKWNAVAGPPMSDYFVLNQEAYVQRYSRDHDGRSVQEQLGVSGSLLEAYRSLIQVRRDNIALRRGGYAPVACASEAVWAFVRDHADQQVLVAINLSGSAQATSLDLADFEITGGATTPLDLLGAETYPALDGANQGAYPLALPPYGAMIAQVALEAPELPVSAVDGRDIPSDLGPGALLATQDDPPSIGDNFVELDQLFLRPEGEALLIGVTGNLPEYGGGLCLLLDVAAGGQAVLDLSDQSPPPSGPRELTGLTLDEGFTPEHLLYINSYGATYYVDHFELRDEGGADKTYRGQAARNTGSGWLSGGINPHDTQVAFDGTNTAGVTPTDVGPAWTATTGFEILLSLADLGLVAGEVSSLRVATFVIAADGTVTDQWLPGLGGDHDLLGIAPDMRAVAGQQFATGSLITAVADPPAGDGMQDPQAADTLAGGPGLRVVGHNPTAGRVAIALRAPRLQPARLCVYDLRGRRVRTLWQGILGPQERRLSWPGDLDGGRRAPAGTYFLRLETPERVRTERVLLVR